MKKSTSEYGTYKKKYGKPDPYRFYPCSRKPHIPEGIYYATVGKVSREYIRNGNVCWDRAMIPFKLVGYDTTVRFYAENNMSPSSRLYPIVAGILGIPPKGKLESMRLYGKKVRVLIKHNIDEYGNVWENVVKVLPPK